MPHQEAQVAYLSENDMSFTGQENAPTSAQALVDPSDDKAQASMQVSSTDQAGQQSKWPDSRVHDASVVVTGSGDKVSASNEVDYQTLLDNLSRATATAPAADTISAPTTAESNENTSLSQTGTEKPLPVGAGLPPRPPPQEKPAIHPSYSANESIRSYHQLPTANASVSPYPQQPPPYRQDVGMPPVNVAPLPSNNFRAANGLLPPPPLATFQQTPQNVLPQQIGGVQASHDRESVSTPTVGAGTPVGEDQERPWGPDVQTKYDQFLHDERVYVTEGVWDRFPPGSRLFVGMSGL